MMLSPQLASYTILHLIYFICKIEAYLLIMPYIMIDRACKYHTYGTIWIFFLMKSIFLIYLLARDMRSILMDWKI